MSGRDVLLALAANPALVRTHVDALIVAGDPDVLRELAAEQQLTPAQVATLVATGDRETVLALIRSRNMPLDLIARDDPWALLAAVDRSDAPDDWIQVLASWPDTAVRRALGARTRERIDIAQVLAGDADCSVAACAAHVWAMPEELASRLYRRTEACIRVALALSGHTPGRILAELTTTGTGGRPSLIPCPDQPDLQAALGEVRRAAARNAATPVEAVTPLLTDPDPTMALALAYRSDLPVDAYDHLVALNDRDVTARIAVNWATPADLLRRLYDEPTGRWRTLVLANPRTPLDVLVRHSRAGGSPGTDFHPDLEGLVALAADRDPRVRLVAAASFNLPTQVRAMLIEDPDASVSLRAARYQTVSAAQLRSVAVRLGPPAFPMVAGHPSCPPDLLQMIAAHSGSPAEAITDVAWQEASPPTALRACLRDPDNTAYVAGNPSAPADTLIELATHADPDVVWEVARNPSLPVEAARLILDRPRATPL